MKKIIKKTILMTILAIIPLISLIDVDAQSNMKISRKTYINTGINNRKEAKFYTNKGYAYCIAPMKTGANQGAILTYKGQINDPGVKYLLETAKTSDEDYLASQIAIWKYYNKYTPDIYKKNENRAVIKKAINLAQQAEKHKNDKTVKTTIKVTNKKAKMSEVEKGKYFKSEAIKINLTNLSSAKITVTSPATIVNSKNNQVKTVKNNDKVYVRVAASKLSKKKTFTIKLSGTTAKTTVEKYAPSNSTLQDLVVLVKTEESASNSTKVSAAPIVRKCEQAYGNYYGKNGNIVDKTTYRIECEKPVCEKLGNKYFGKKGNEVDAITYDIECNKHTCEKVKDIYFGKDGKQVDETTYDIECNKHTCEKVKDIYFDKDGKQVDETTYDIECNKHTCEKINDIYFDKDGKQVDEKTYDIECNKHTCEVIDNIHFGKDGKQVDEITYDIECNEHVCQKVKDTYFGKDGRQVDETIYDIECNKHTCEKINDTYFGKEGNAVTEEVYNSECIHTCEKVNDKYFGIDGEEVDFDEYKSQCIHSCEIYDNKYFGKDAYEVDETTYKNECLGQVIVVPDTSTSPLEKIVLSILGITLVSMATLLVIKSTKA